MPNAKDGGTKTALGSGPDAKDPTIRLEQLFNPVSTVVSATRSSLLHTYVPRDEATCF